MSHVTQALKIIALGGLGEVGMNCLILESAGRLLVLDCGVTFPDHEPGIDIIHPDFEYLLERADQIEGVVLTHGHEDHIGALPYLLRELDRSLPIHGPPYALGLVQERLREVEIGFAPQLYETRPRESFALGPFGLTPFRVTHSIPDSTGLVIRVSSATIVHTGDFKIEENPLDGENFDAELLQQVGDEGVRLLLSDSTNSEVEGCAGGERPVVAALETRIAKAEGRVVVCLFASNVPRLGAVLETARRMGRKVLLLGRSLQTHSRLAQSLGRLGENADLLVSEQAAQNLPRRELLVVATGSQGEASAALVNDLKQRGMLDDTLVIWGGEFGRTPMVQEDKGQPGRDHHKNAFSIWMAGGGIKPGITHGATDELGYNAVENIVTIHDFHATLLHQMGIDHKKLTYRFQGRDFRLTDVAGNVVKDILV